MKYIVLALMLFIYSCGKNSGSNSSSSSNSDSNTAPVETPAEATPEEKTMTEEFMELVNDHRISIGLRPLTHDAELGTIATQHSANMANGSVAFGHGGFSSRCTAARSALGGGNWCGENVAMGQKTVQAAFTSWMNSSGHRANIEKSSASHTGFGFKKSASGTWYWTQIFIQR